MAPAVDRTGLVRNWSAWMSTNQFRHMNATERAPILPAGTWTWGENIARHSNTSSDCVHVHTMLMNSPGHRANILNPAFQFAALGAHLDSNGWWVTQVFFSAPNYPPAPSLPPCPPGHDCDGVALQSSGGRFHMMPIIGAPATHSFLYGVGGDVPFSGDWNCDGVETLGLYRRSDGYVYLRNSNTQGIADIAFYFGNAGDLPVSGDFNGDGCDTVSLYRPGEARFYIINRLGSNGGGLGQADYSFLFGNHGDKPFAGDFNGDGIDTIGLHRESSGLVYFRNTNTTGVAESQFLYGIANDQLMAGDWDGDGDDTVGIYRRSNGTIYLKQNNTQGVADHTFTVGSYQAMVEINP